MSKSLDLTQALFADGAINGIFTILVDYYDQSLRSDQEIAQARIDATVACADFDAFATEIDLLDGELDDPTPGFAAWSSCEGLDELGIAIDRANLQALVEVPAALEPLAEFGGDWEVDPSIGWNQLQFLSPGRLLRSSRSHSGTDHSARLRDPLVPESDCVRPRGGRHHSRRIRRGRHHGGERCQRKRAASGH